MKLLDRYLQAVNKHLPKCRQGDSIARYQPQQYVIGPVFPAHWLAPRVEFPWAIIVCAVVAVLIAFGPWSQASTIEAMLCSAEVLFRCFHRLWVDGEQILHELIADWNSINASLDWAS